MKIANRLTNAFLTQHSTDAARVLEQMPANDVARFLLELHDEIRSVLIIDMLPGKTASCFESLSEQEVIKLISGIPMAALARIFRLLPIVKRNQILEQLPERSKRQLKRHLKFPPTSVGSLMESSFETLPVNISVAEAIKRIGRFDKDPNGEVFVIDEMHRLVGAVEPGKLLRSNQRSKLSSVMQTRFQKLAASAETSTLVKHPGWKTSRKLPVIDRDRTLLGIILYQKVQEIEPGLYSAAATNPVENLISLAAFYWISAAQLLAGIFSVAAKRQDNKT